MFEGATNVGDAPLGGEATYHASTETYVITGSGADIYGETDAFYYVWRQVEGDMILTADVAFADTTGNHHKKAGWMVRGSLAPDAPYADAIVHADGLISLQYWKVAGGATQEVMSAVRAPATIRLERAGDLVCHEGAWRL